MSIIELKTEFHKLIDSIDNEARLQDLYDSVALILNQPPQIDRCYHNAIASFYH
jgi:hypothetical protein